MIGNDWSLSLFSRSDSAKYTGRQRNTSRLMDGQHLWPTQLHGVWKEVNILSSLIWSLRTPSLLWEEMGAWVVIFVRLWKKKNFRRRNLARERKAATEEIQSTYPLSTPKGNLRPTRVPSEALGPDNDDRFWSEWGFPSTGRVLLVWDTVLGNLPEVLSPYPRASW